MDYPDPLAIEFLENLTAGYLKKSQLYMIYPNDTVAKALELLAENQILSAPVLDDVNNQVLGSVDVLDLASFIVSIYTEHKSGGLPHLYNPQDFEKRFSEPVIRLINSSKRDPFVPVFAYSSIAYVISQIFQTGIHRVAVLDNNCKIVGQISQSDIIQLIYQNPRPFKNLTSRRLIDLNLDLGPVVSVHESAFLIEALRAILNFGISGLAVVDSNGRLINNLSVSNFKGITKQNFFKMEESIEFLFSSRAEKIPPVTCTMDTTLEEVIVKLATNRVHRIFVVDYQFKPMNVISLTTVMRVFTKSPVP